MNSDLTLTLSGCAGNPTDLSLLDPVSEADAPPQAVRLAAGELLLRIEEERRRRAAGLDALASRVPQRRMFGKAGACWTARVKD